MMILCSYDQNHDILLLKIINGEQLDLALTDYQMTNPLAIDNSTANLDPVFKKHVEEMWIDLRAE